MWIVELHVTLSPIAYVVDVNPDGDALGAVDGDVVLQVLAEHLAGHQVVQHNLETEKIYMTWKI
jgi:hypothetical protein